MAKKCPWGCCSGAAGRVIYMGLPLWHCDKCGTIWGFWSFVPAFWFNGWLYPYEGSYWKALWEWLNLDGGADA